MTDAKLQLLLDRAAAARDAAGLIIAESGRLVSATADAQVKRLASGGPSAQREY